MCSVGGMRHGYQIAPGAAREIGSNGRKRGGVVDPVGQESPTDLNFSPKVCFSWWEWVEKTPPILIKTHSSVK